MSVAFPTDQEQFDATVARNTRIVLQVLAGVGIFAAVLLSTIALLVATSNHSSTMPMSRATAAVTPAAPATPAAAAAPATSSPAISLSVAGGNKRGPDGKMHDSYTKTDFAVKVGQPTRLRIDNNDDSPHTITAVGTGVNITVRPGVHTYTLVATKTGRFEWVCALPCDDWAMTHPGYMAGYITAT